ncbi:MAG: ATP-dependent Clp endopeptidase proteolytic subunit ClpP [Bacteroidia bacterium]
MSRIAKERFFILSDGINAKSVADAIRFIQEANADDKAKEKEFRKFKRRPIKLILNTPGGSVYDGFALIAAIDQSRTPVHIDVPGRAMSMGLPILCAGHRRTMSRFATLLYHQAKTWTMGTTEDLKDDAKELERIETLVEKYLFDRTALTPKDLKPYKTQQKDWHITPEEALRFKIVDEVI